MTPKKSLTSFLDRLTNVIMGEENRRLQGQRTELKQVLSSMFRVEGQDDDNFIISVILGLLIIKHSGIRFTRSNEWRRLVTDTSFSDYWIDWKIFRQFHNDAGLPLRRLTVTDRLRIEERTFAQMHEFGVDYTRFLEILDDFKMLIPVLSERVKLSNDMFPTDIQEGPWTAALFPVLWGLDMIQTGPFLAGQHGRHRKVQAGVSTRQEPVSVSNVSFFNNGEMPIGALFVGGTEDIPYVTILSKEPDNEDLRMTSEFGVEYFQNRLRGLVVAQSVEISSQDVSTPKLQLPVLPEVPELDSDLLDIPKCVEAHRAAVNVHSEATALLANASQASQLQAELATAEKTQRSARELVERLRSELEQAEAALEHADADVQVKSEALSELGEVDQLSAQLSQAAEVIGQKLAVLSQVKQALAAL